MEDRLTYTLTHQEIVYADWCIPSQILMKLLKDKGAPIDGRLWFKVREGYSCEQTDNVDGSITFTFWKK